MKIFYFILPIISLSVGWSQKTHVTVSGTGSYATNDSVTRMHIYLVEGKDTIHSMLSEKGGYYKLETDLDPSKDWTLYCRTFSSAAEYWFHEATDSLIEVKNLEFQIYPSLMKLEEKSLPSIRYAFNSTEVPDNIAINDFTDFFLEYPMVKIELTQIVNRNESTENVLLRERKLKRYFRKHGIRSKNIVISNKRYPIPEKDEIYMSRFEGKVVVLEQ